MHRGTFEERGLVLIPLGKRNTAQEFNLASSEILTGHIMVSVSLQESQTELEKRIPRGPSGGGVSGARSQLHGLLHKPVTVK